MLIGLFKNKNPLEYLFLLIYALLFYGILFFKTNISPVTEYSVITDWFQLDFSIIPRNYLVVISILMAYIQIILFFGMIRKNGLSNDQSLIPAYIYITISGFYPSMILFSPASISFFIIIFAIYNLFKTYDIEFPLQKFFFVSFYIGIGAIFYSPMSIFLVFLILVLPALKTPTIREFLIIITGFLIPVYFTGLYFFMTDSLPEFIELMKDNVPVTLFYLDNDSGYYLPPLIYASILLLIALFSYFFQSGSRTIRIIIYNRILISCIIITLSAFLIIPANRWLIGLYLLAPASVYIGNMLSNDQRRIFNQVAFSILFLLAVYSEYIYFRNF